jgi:inorganic triphosphatase YgiF
MHEIELKFQIPPAARADVQQAFAALAPVQTRLRAQYHDTPDLRLAMAGIALRLRLEGVRWVQTVKAPGGDTMHRIEHEVAVATPAADVEVTLDLQRHGHSPAGPLLAAALGDQAQALRVTFETDVQRQHLQVRHGGASVELALDLGVVRAGGGELALHEIEFELMDGSVDAMLDLIRQWVRQHGLWLDVRSKAERGHLLAHGLVVAAAKPVRGWADQVWPASDGGQAAVITQALDDLLSLVAALAGEVAEAAHLRELWRGAAALHRLLRSSGGSGDAVLHRCLARLDELGQVLGRDDSTSPGAGSDDRHTSDASLRDEELIRSGAMLRSTQCNELWLDLLGWAYQHRRADSA